jgi:hypothetical protein
MRYFYICLAQLQEQTPFLLHSKEETVFYVIERMNQSNSQTTNFIVLKVEKLKG